MRNYHKGLTLIEATIALGILVVIIAFAFQNQSNAFKMDRNIKRVNDIKLYINALELYHLQHKGYPATESKNDPYCLGHGYPQEICKLTPIYNESDQLNNELRPIVPSLPIDVTPLTINGLEYYGYGYQCFDTFENGLCKRGAIAFWQEGKDRECPKSNGKLLNETIAGNTYCYIGFEAK
jgi:type II secretory pathway pseudopilin PulG